VFQLVSNRSMAICGFARPEEGEDVSILPRDEVADRFYDQMDLMTRKKLGPYFDAIRLELKDHEPEDLPSDQYAAKFSIEQGRKGNSSYFVGAHSLPARERNRDPIVGRFPALHIKITINGMSWDVLIRPTVTACLLERPDWLSKLWFNCEGVPANPLRMPNENDAIKFIQLTTKLADLFLPRLRKDYVAALKRKLASSAKCKFEEARLRICFADVTDKSFSELIDTLSLTKATFEDLAAGKYGTAIKEGAKQVTHFAQRLSGAEPSPSDIEFRTNQPLLAALFCRPMEERATPGKHRYVMAGLASPMGMISSDLPTDDQWKVDTYKPELIRSLSAARPISARIADNAARGLDSFARDNFGRKAPAPATRKIAAPANG
jgi:hypothetical protein